MDEPGTLDLGDHLSPGTSQRNGGCAAAPLWSLSKTAAALSKGPLAVQEISSLLQQVCERFLPTTHSLAQSIQDPHTPFTMPSMTPWRSRWELHLQASFCSRLLLRYTIGQNTENKVTFGDPVLIDKSTMQPPHVRLREHGRRGRRL